MLGNLTGWHALIVLAIVLLLFGSTKLPALAKSLGQSTKILRTELKAGGDGEAAAVDTAEGSALVDAPTPSSATQSEGGQAGAV